MKTNNIKSFSKSVIIINLSILVVVSIVLLILGLYSWLIGYILGSITSYITFLMHANSASNNSSVRHIFIGAGIRILISAIPLALCLFVDFINIIAVFIGLIVIKVTILILGFITNKKYTEGGNKTEDESN
jgi:hypothetical protein